MKKILLIILFVFPVFIAAGLYFINKESFVSPISYRFDLVIRCDSRGEGFFACQRSAGRMHNGLDLYAAIGTPVLACRAGIVRSVDSNPGMGRYIVIRHGNGLTSIYGHLSKIFIKKGQLVRQGQVVGAVGKTGNASGRAILPHVHFEIRKDNVPVDPLLYLR